jgi:hypothetical protein
MLARLTTSRRSPAGVGVTLIELLVVSLIIGTVTALTWSVHNRQRRMLAREQAMESTIPARRERIEGLIDQTTEVVQFRLVAGTADGKPMAGMPVRMRVKEDYSVPAYLGESDVEGRVRFNRIPHGTYVVSFHAERAFWGETELSLAPGNPVSTTIVVPAHDKPFDVTVKVNWPEDIDARSPQLAFGMDNLHLSLPSPGLQAPITWNLFVESAREGTPSFWVDNSGAIFNRAHVIGIGDPIGWRAAWPRHLQQIDLGSSYEPSPKLTWPGSEFRLTDLAIAVPLSQPQARPVKGAQFTKVWVDSAGWDHQFTTAGDETTLTLTPTEDSLSRIREGFTAIDADQQPATNAESSPPDEPKPPAPDDALPASAIPN